MSCAQMVMAALHGQPVSRPLEMPAAVLLGREAVGPSIDVGPLVLGQVLHFAISIAWAVPFTELVIGTSRRTAVLSGALWGLVVWGAMAWIVLPLAGLGDLARATWRTGAGALVHLLWGLGVAAAFMPFQGGRHRRVAFRLPELRMPQG